MPDQYNQRAQSDRKKHGGLSVGRRFAILQRYNFHCQYCGEDASCVDHIVPWSYGGTDDDDNLVAACHICNLIASGKVFETIDEKRAHILERRHEHKERDERRSRLAICPCGSPFQPNIDEASNVLCGPCYLRATLRRETGPSYDVQPPYVSPSYRGCKLRFATGPNNSCQVGGRAHTRGFETLSCLWRCIRAS